MSGICKLSEKLNILAQYEKANRISPVGFAHIHLLCNGYISLIKSGKDLFYEKTKKKVNNQLKNNCECVII